MNPFTFGEYVPDKLLRQNEREQVYAAFDSTLKRPVIIKVILQSVPVGSDQRLAELIDPLHHPHIAQTYKVGITDGHLFLVQEDLTESLADHWVQNQAQGKTVSLEEIGRQLRSIADPLDYAHSQGILHGNLNPSSILLTELDEPILTDFGLAALLGSEWTLPGYRAPEQVNDPPATVLSDLYALGLILYEWVTGHPPFLDQTLPGGTLLPPAVEQVILKAVADNPTQRFGSATELADAFTLALAEASFIGSTFNKPDARPAKIGRYEIEAELGQRGNLTVYRARDPKLERPVAIKLLPAQFATDNQSQLLFQREIELIAALEHHAIVEVYDFGEHEGQPFVVMPYLAGGTLELRLRTGPLEPQQFVPILVRVAEALDAAHARGIIHGQVKPGNILFDEQGQAYLSDFTLSTIAAASPNLSDQGGLAEVANYMSPEQVRALVEGVPTSLDGRSDIYALGVILFELLTGNVPYRASTRLETARRHLTEPVPQLHLMELDLIKTYQPIINRAMAKNPADRYANAASLTRHLQEVTSGRWYLARLVDRTKLIGPTEIVKVETETNLAEPEPPSVSTHKIGRYLIERELGRGGMAVVYLAYDPRLKRRVAIKILPPQFMKLPRFQDRFHQEAELVARLKHPAIVSIYDFGESEGRPFIVMQYLPGGTLAEQLRKGPIKLQLLAPIMERVAAALDEAHTRHVIHHDVKPGNIIFNTGGEAFLSDFGIAVLTEATAVLSEHKDLGFTPNYVSPERVRAYRAKRPAEVDGRSDIYSLGVVLFETLTGHIPFQADNSLAIGLAHMEAPIPQINEIEPSLIEVAQKIIERALAKSPDDRYQTSGELAQAVKDLASGRWVFRKLLD